MLNKWYTLAIIVILSQCVMGCAATKGLIKVQAAEEMKVADKVTGVESLKVADKAEAENIMGSGKIEKNQTSTSVGGDMTNDSEVIKQYVKANEELSKKILETQERLSNINTRTLYGIIGSLFVLIFKYELQIRSINKRLFAMIEYDEENEERVTKRLLDVALEKTGGNKA